MARFAISAGGALAMSVTVGALLGGCDRPAASYVGAAAVPVTRTAFTAEAGDFRFAVIGDRTGGHRPGVFEQAMGQVNLLQPDFVISVGDQVEGYTEDEAEIARQWDELEGFVQRLAMPFFHVAGNHDLSNGTMTRYWLRRLGADHYHFTYKNVLFIALNTEDPPPSPGGRKAALAGFDGADIQRVFQILKGDKAEADRLLAADPKLGEIARRITGGEAANIGADQVADVKRALRENPNVRWTFVLMHRPVWRDFYDSPAFREIEAALADRPYTMLAGHLHSYVFERHHERDYIQMGTTGGTQQADPDAPGTMDHVLWVTMKKSGPEIANLRLDGVLDRTLAPLAKP